MENMKAWYYSRTVWGALVAVTAPLLQLGGLDVSPENQGVLADNLLALAAGIGGLVALYGRLSATQLLR